MDENKSTGMEDCEIRHKHRSAKEEKDLISRLNRIEGQVRGVKAMVQDERYCTDILVQVSAIQSALNGFSRTLLSSHVKSCVVEEIKNGERTKKPPIPFTTSTMQQEASKALNFSTQKTMRVAQQLYEGVDVKEPEDRVGHVVAELGTL